MSRNHIVGTVSALALLAAPAVAVAHGDSHHHHGRHHHKHHVKKAHTREVTGQASATVTSFTAGELTLALPSGKSYTADVTDRTVIICRSLRAPAATTASHGGGGDDNSGPGRKDDGDDHDRGDDHGDDATTTAPASTTVPPSTTTPTPRDPAGHNDDHAARCGTDVLVAGAKVSAAKLSLKGDTVVWKKVTVVK